MALKITNLVDIPEHTVRIPSGKYIYIYLTKKTYRVKGGQVRNDRICIGKATEDGNKMIPNQRYYDLLQKDKPASLPDMIRSCGSYAVCKKIAEDLRLDGYLQKAFPNQYESILTGAHYMLTSGSIMYYLDDWLDGSLSFNKNAMDDVSIGRTFRAITEEGKRLFFLEWLKNHGSKECIAYDVTSISSYSANLTDVEYGYNRDREKLPQVNLGMYFSEKSRIPVYYRVYPGSIVDKTHCNYMIEGTDSLNLKRVYFVMDRGFYTMDNLKFITDSGHHFMITMPPTLKLYRELIDKNKESIINNIDCKLPGRLIYCKKVEVNPYGFRMNAHVFYNQTKAADNAAAFYDRLKAMEDDLQKMDTVPPKGSIYHEYYTIADNNGVLTFSQKKEAIKQTLSRCGFFVIAETVFSKSSEEILECYADRDSIEKSFDDLKNEIDMDRIRCSRDETANGKMFVAFISLIFLSRLRQQLTSYASEKKYTMRKILTELDKIKVVYDAERPEKYRLFNPLTKKQKDILDALGMEYDTAFQNLMV